MLKNSRFIIFLILASIICLTGCKDASIPDIRATDPARITSAVPKENDQTTPTSSTQESVETKTTSTDSETDLTAQSTSDVDSKDIEKTTPDTEKIA